MLFGAATQTYFHHPTPILFKQRNSPDSPKQEPKSLVDICKSSIPPYHPHPLLRNGHLQTCATAVFSAEVPLHYKRFVLSADSLDSLDGSNTGQFSVDVVVPPPFDAVSTLSKQVLQPSHPEYFPPRTTEFTEAEFEAWKSDEETNPIVIVLHGLSGGSHETYVRLALEPLVRSKKDGGLGYDALVVNARGCAWTPLKTPRMFSALFTADVRQTVKLLRRKFPNRPLMAVGFSLGGNILANYLGEEGASCEIHAAVILSSPHNIDACAKFMYASFFGRQYSKIMTTSLKTLFERNMEMLSKNPNINIEAVRKSVYLYDYDHACTSRMYGFRTGGEYYRASSSVDKLLNVRVPTLIINSEDDPIAVKQAHPGKEAEANEYLCFVTTNIGGHIGWFEWNLGRWFPKPIMEFLRNMADLEVVKDSDGTDYVKINGVLN